MRQVLSLPLQGLLGVPSNTVGDVWWPRPSSPLQKEQCALRGRERSTHTVMAATWVQPSGFKLREHQLEHRLVFACSCAALTQEHPIVCQQEP